MKTTRTQHLVAAALLGALACGAGGTSAQTRSDEQTLETLKTPIGELKYEVGYPTKDTSQKLYDEMDFQRACQAYMWSFPAVSFASIKAGLFRDLGATYNSLPGLPRHQEHLPHRQ
jgi:hypothetical protein